MKKTLSIFLSLVLILVSISSALTFSTSAEIETDYFLDAANFNLYSYYANGTGGQGTVGSAATPENATVAAGTATKGGETVKTVFTRQYGSYIVVELPVTQKNTDYTFTFDYYFTYDNTAADAKKMDVLQYGGIMAADGVAVNPLSDTDKYIGDSRFNGLTTTPVDKTWLSKTFTFNSGEHTEILFVARLRANGNDGKYTAHFGNFKLQAPEYFENAANFNLYSYYANGTGGQGTVGSAATPENATVTAGTATKGGETVKTVYTRQYGSYIVVKLPVTQKNTDYTFTFDYYFTYDNTAADAKKMDVLQYGGIMAADGVAVNPLSDRDKYIGDSRFDGPTTAPVDKTWLSKTFTFNSGEHTEILFVARLRANGNDGKYTAHFGNFNLAAKTLEYFEDPDNVKLYDYYANGVGGQGTVGSATTPLATTVTAGTISKDGKTINTFYTRAFGSYVAIQLPVTEKNTDYTFTFDYYFTYDNTASDEKKMDVLQYGGIMAADSVAVNPLSDRDKYIGDSRFDGPTTTPVDKTWLSKTFTFNSGEHTEILFVARLRANGNDGKYTAYFSNFNLRAITKIDVEYAKETAKIVPTDDLSFDKAIIGEPFSFTMKKANGITATVKYNGNDITAKDGIYTIDQVANGDKLTVTTSGEEGAQMHNVNVGLNGEVLDEYNADVYSKNFWEGDTVYHEAVMFTNPSDSQSQPQLTKKLLYPIDDVVSVRSNDLKTWYIKDIDYTITENGELQWLEGSDIPVYEGALAALQKESDVEEDSTVNKDGYSTYAAGYPINDTHGLQIIAKDSIHEAHTVYVTYTHSKSWDGIDYSKVISKKQGSNLVNLYDKLKEGKDINVLVYGDSVATGASSSGMKVNYPSLSVGVNTDNSSDLIWEDQLTWSEGSVSNGYAPYAPTFFEQATDEIIKEYGKNNKANYWNIAAGGRSSQWGLANLPLRLEKFEEYTNGEVTPDLVYIKFAANEVSRGAEEYKGYIQGIVDILKEKYPDVNIILLSGKVNNKRAIQYNYDMPNDEKIAAGYPTKVNYQAEQEDALFEIAKENKGVITAGTFSVWKEVFKNKAPEDYLTNNINHGNDFWAKTTASVIVAAAENNGTVVTAYNNAAAIRPSTASSTGKNGLRIYNKIDKYWIEAADIVEFGSIAIKAEILSGSELVLDAEGVKKGIAYKQNETALTLWETSDDSYIFTAYLTNISAKNYGADYSVRTYAIDADGNIYYGETVNASVFKIANAIDNGLTADGSAPSEADTSAFYAFVTAENAFAYSNWCTANNFELGNLYLEKYQ